MFYKAPVLLNQQKYSSRIGRPKHYPIPQASENMLFFVQRNHNANTVVFSVNKNLDGSINEKSPLDVKWIRYEEGGGFSDLTVLQRKLIYGYSSKKINNNSFEFVFDRFKNKRFFIHRNDNKDGVFCYLEGTLVQLVNIYAHADSIGTFPQLKCIELYGVSVEGNNSIVQKVLI